MTKRAELTGSVLHSFPHSAPVKLSSEIDGLRILSSSTLSFVQKVPSPLLSLLLPGSSHPSSLLLYAHTLFLAASPKSSTLLTLLRPDLSLAVSGCLEAASELWDPEQQRYVLKAALYGRAFLDGEGDAGIVERGKALKVLNCLRGWEVGVPISFEQCVTYSLSSSSPVPNLTRSDPTLPQVHSHPPLNAPLAPHLALTAPSLPPDRPAP
jgi:vacuolar protein sorting-associated protein 16